MGIVNIGLLQCARDDSIKPLLNVILLIPSLDYVDLPRQRKGLMWWYHNKELCELNLAIVITYKQWAFAPKLIEVEDIMLLYFGKHSNVT